MTLRSFAIAIIFHKNFSDVGKSPFTLFVGKNLIAELYKKPFFFSLVGFSSSCLDIMIFLFFELFHEHQNRLLY